MITVISGTNRPNSLTSVAANHYEIGRAHV